MLNDGLQALALDKNTGLVYFLNTVLLAMIILRIIFYVGVVYTLGIINQERNVGTLSSMTMISIVHAPKYYNGVVYITAFIISLAFIKSLGEFQSWSKITQ